MTAYDFQARLLKLESGELAGGRGLQARCPTLRRGLPVPGELKENRGIEGVGAIAHLAIK